MKNIWLESSLRYRVKKELLQATIFLVDNLGIEFDHKNFEVKNNFIFTEEKQVDQVVIKLNDGKLCFYQILNLCCKCGNVLSVDFSSNTVHLHGNSYQIMDIFN